MITREEYARILESALEELSGIILRDAEDVVETAVPIRTEIDEAVQMLRGPNTKREQVLTTSFGLVDEFVRFRWTAIVEELYQEYVATEDRPSPQKRQTAL